MCLNGRGAHVHCQVDRAGGEEVGKCLASRGPSVELSNAAEI